MIFSKCQAVPLSLAVAFSVPAESTSRKNSPDSGHGIHRSVPQPGVRTHLVIQRERFRAGGFKRWFYGSNYRKLWTIPVEVAVLDLDKAGRGLTPLRTGGCGQSISLTLRDWRVVDIRFAHWIKIQPEEYGMNSRIRSWTTSFRT